MHWSDEAIVLSVKKHGESSAVMRVLAKSHGVFSGILKGASSKANRGVAQAGNVVSVGWNARLAEHMGMWKAEMVRPHAAFIMQDAMKLAALSSACALIEAAMPERHPYPKLYKRFYDFLEILVIPSAAEGSILLKDPSTSLRFGRDDNLCWQEEYVKLELGILAESGFGLDLKHCAATGSTEDLMYVSPKSGRAVSREAGEPYKDKLLTLPEFLHLEEGGGKLADGLALTGYFLEHWLLEPHNRKLPAARQRLVKSLT